MSRVTRKEWYRRVNEAWPETIPPMTPAEAMRAGRRLYRFVTGKTWTGPVKLTTGRRRNDVRRGVMYVSASPNYGQSAWENLVHDLSHDFAFFAGVASSHGGEHARLERRMIKEVVDRGWLDGALKDAAKPEMTREERIVEERLTTLARVDVLIEGWERRAKRAVNALKKLHARRRRALKALDAPTPEPKERGLSLKQRTEAIAREHGIKVERDTGIESRSLWVSCDALEEEADPFHGDHYVDTWAEAAERVNVYVEKLTGRKP